MNGLAVRIVRVTLAIGLIVIVIATVVSLISTSRMATQMSAANNLTALRMLEGAIEERLTAASGIMDRAGSLAAESGGPVQADEALRTLLSGSRSLFRQMTVAEFSGSVQAAVPDAVTETQVKALPVFARVRSGSTGFFSTSTTSAAEIWATRATVNTKGTPVIILGELDAGFIRRALQRAVRDEPNRAALLVDGHHVIAHEGLEFAPDLSRAEWRPEGSGTGQVSFVGPDGHLYAGYYDDLGSSSGVEWRAISAERMSGQFMTLWRAVGPSVLVLVFGVAVAVALSWSMSSSLVRPLRDLERTAKHAASGAYVKPLPQGAGDEMGRVADAFNQVALRLNALHDLSQLLASASNLEQVLDGILAAVGHMVGPGASAIYLLSSDGTLLEPVRTRGSAFSEARAVSVTKGGWLASALDSISPITLTGPADAVAREIPGVSADATGALAAPLVAGNDRLGLVVTLQKGGEDVTEAEREMVKTFSAQAAVAVQTSRLFVVESRSRQVSEVLRAVAEQLVHTQELRFALDVVQAIVADFFGAKSVDIVLRDPESVGVSAVSEHLQRDHAALALARLVTQSEEAWRYSSAEDGEDARALLEDDGRIALIVPICVGQEMAGVLVAALDAPLEDERLKAAKAIGDQVSLAVENAYHYDRALSRAENLETIFNISQAVASSLQVNVVLNRVLDVVQKILSADAVMLWFLDPAHPGSGTAMVRGDVPAHVASTELVSGQDVPGLVFSSKQPVVMRELSLQADGLIGSMARQGMTGLMAVPLLARGASIGVLMVLSRARGAVGEEEMNILQTFGSQAALAIDTARMYSKEHQVATVLQRSILPALPTFEEVEAGSVYLPAGKEAEIGGDYYDMFRGPDGAIWFAIADVCGKGVDAATRTSMIKYAVRAFVAAGKSPASAVAGVNHMVTETGEPSNIVTLLVGRYDPMMGILTWANGGHPPAALRRNDGALVPLGTTGPLLGAMSVVEYEESSLGVGPGDRIMMYTDGVIEARSEGAFFGDDRAIAELTTERSVQQDAEALRDAVRAFVRGELRDDVAILVVQIRGTKAHR